MTPPETPSDEPTFRALFPNLALIEHVPLAAPVFDLVASSPEEAQVLRSLREALLREPMGVAETPLTWILDASPAIVSSWMFDGELDPDAVVRFLAQLSAEVYVVLDGREAISTDDAEAVGVWTHAAPASSIERQKWLAALETLAAFAATLAGAATWGSLMSLRSTPQPPEVAMAWQRVMNAPLPAGDHAGAGAVISRYLLGLSPRDRAILVGRVLGEERRTLDSIATEWAITRERVRQLEKPIISGIHNLYLESDDWRPVRWATEALSRRLGALAPASELNAVLPGVDDRARSMVLFLAGHRRAGDLIVAGAARLPELAELPCLNGTDWVIDEFALIESLTEMGVKDAYLETAVKMIEGLHRIDGQLVVWGSAQTDKAVAVLEVRDEPEDVDVLFDIVGGSSARSLRQRLFEDPRINRVTKSKVGLAKWGGTRYTSIVDLMATRLAGGPLTIEELGREMEATYEVSANSIYMYAYAPVFKVTGDTVALRRADDPFVPRHRPDSVVGLFQLTPEVLAWHVAVDNDVLRGSGRAMPHEVGTFLGLMPGGPGLLLRSDLGHIAIGWSETSHTGPNLGSLQAHASGVRARLGDVLRLTFDRGSLAMGVTVLPPGPDDESPSERVSRLSGLELSRCGDLTALAQAVGVPTGSLVEALRRRKEIDLADAAEKVSGTT